jgi:hypothetical protein
VFARVLMCVFLSIWMRARARACPCVYACLCERMYGFVRFHRIAIPRVCVASVCGRPALCAPSHRTVAACGIYSSARAARCSRARGCVWCDRPVVARVRPQVSHGDATLWELKIKFNSLTNET